MIRVTEGQGDVPTRSTARGVGGLREAYETVVSERSVCLWRVCRPPFYTIDNFRARAPQPVGIGPRSEGRRISGLGLGGGAGGQRGVPPTNETSGKD